MVPHQAALPRHPPSVVVCANGIALTRDPTWIHCDLEPGQTYRLRAILDGESDTEDKAALLSLDVADRDASPGLGISMSASAGPYIYLRSGAGFHRTDRFFDVTSPARRVGVVAWGSRGRTELKSLTIEKVTGADRPAEFFFSFDVEAPGARAVAGPIDSLVWGKLGASEYGIRRICEVLEQYKITGNFLIDFATCTFEGDHAARRIPEFLLERGHEVHLHLHPEWLAPAWGLRIPSGQSILLDSTPFEMSRRLLEFTVRKYQQFVGEAPRVFRSGAYRMNPHVVLAAGALGIESLSNLRGDALHDVAVGGDVITDREPFVWENGVVEIPVDVSSPEAGSFPSYLRKFDSAMNHKDVERTFNVVMHSWSMLRRNENGIHDRFEPEYERRLHQMCEHAVGHGRTYGYGEYLDKRRINRPIVRVSELRNAEPERLVYLTTSGDMANCTICDTAFARAKSTLDTCPACGLGVRHRQLKYVLDTHGNVFDGRSVLAQRALAALRPAFFRGATQLAFFDSGPVFDVAVRPVGELSAVADGAFDCFLGLDLLDQAGDDDHMVVEVARVLAQDGLLVAAAPKRTDVSSVLGVMFTVSQIPGYDPVTTEWHRICVARKR